ncbi:MAG: dienelactone hydrolase family protein [Chthoniobacterales bacterium]|nr:dienelactone hydrolase family protein [Chthoniobacterales bacterium]
MQRPLFLFAPGAGAPSSHRWMQHWRQLLQTVGEVSTFDYPYMLEGKRRPDRLSELIAAHRGALQRARQVHHGPTILIGKSMGSRIGCHVSLEEAVSALVCLSYPLCGGGDPTKLRDKVLREISAPILFIQGTRDPLCPLELLKQIRPEMKAPNQLHVVQGGDHSLCVTRTELKRSGKTQDDLDRRILAVIEKFVDETLSRLS